MTPIQIRLAAWLALLLFGVAGQAREKDSPEIQVSEPMQDSGGVISYRLTTPWQSKPVQLRILEPRSLRAEEPRRFLLVLPVEQGEETRFGDGLAEVRRLGLHDRYGLVVVAPSFAELPWYADHPSDPRRADETHLLRGVIPLIDRLYPSKHPVRLLLGFSKSGWGACSLILRHPELFNAAAAWDAPLMKDRPNQFGMDAAFGNQEHFTQYQVTRLFEQKADLFQSRKRLVLQGDGNFQSQMQQAHQLLDGLRIPHDWVDGPPRKHEWSSGWVAGMVSLLVGMSREVVEPYDLLIKNGRVVDGSGNPWFQGDVAVRGDRIVAVGRDLAGVAARRTVSASGLIVAPGFIDMHSHSDYLLLEDGLAQSKIRQGVTTELLGEGGSVAPAKGEVSPHRATVGGKMVEWTTLAGYFEALEKAGTSVNVASYVGLDSIWQSVMGKSFARPSAEQKAQMRTLVEEAMKEGAFGLSSMLAMPPGSLATTDDIVELANVAGRNGGIFSSHIRNEGTGVIEAVKEAIAVGERGGLPVDIIHLKIADQKYWGRMFELVELIEKARQRGVNVQANVYPYTRGSNNLSSIIPPWAHEGGNTRMLARLKDPKDRERLKKEIREGLPDWYNHYTAVGGDWSRMLIAGRGRYEGLTMDRVLALRSKDKNPTPDTLDELFDILIEEGGSVPTVYAHHTDKDMQMALVQPWCSIGSDGSAYAVEGPLRRGNPHPRSFGTFPRLLGVYVRELKLLSLEDAVRKMTSLNAAKLGIQDRGLIRPGNFADLTLFDPERVADRATYTKPFEYSVGIEYVIVNGQLVLEKGKHTEARPGRALRRGS